MKHYKTEQEIFWKTTFGNNYTTRNTATFSNRINTISKDLLKNNLQINSAFEIGTNVGKN